MERAVGLFSAVSGRWRSLYLLVIRLTGVLQTVKPQKLTGIRPRLEWPHKYVQRLANPAVCMVGFAHGQRRTDPMMPRTLTPIKFVFYLPAKPPPPLVPATGPPF